MTIRTDIIGNNTSTDSTAAEEWDDIRTVPVSSEYESILLKYVLVKKKLRLRWTLCK